MVSYVITGGRGIGLEFATQLSAKPENHVFSLVREPKSVPKLTDLAKERKNLHVFQADITDLPALRKAAKAISEITGGTLDVLINNAAWLTWDLDNFKSLSEFQGEEEGGLTNDLNASYRANVLGPIYTTNTFLPLLRAGKTKKVITLSTGVADLDFVKVSELAISVPYAISKAAVNMVNAKYAVDLKAEGFTFLAISPGYVATADTSGFTDEHMVGVGKMVTAFKKINPNFTGEALTPTESVGLMLTLIDKSTVKETGSFFSQHGDRNWLQ